MFRFLFFLPLLFTLSIFGQNARNYSTPGTHTFTVPNGVTVISVKAWGAGGGGDGITYKAGGGGAFASINTISVTPGQTFTVIVGKGAGEGTGDNGGDSRFGDLVMAKGGKGGTVGGAGGLASESYTAPSIGTTAKWSGGNGGNGANHQNYSGAGGGGAAGSLSNGSNGQDAIWNNGVSRGGAGGALGGGNGGNGEGSKLEAQDGFLPGGGGGQKRAGSSKLSGGGGNGMVIVSWYCKPENVSKHGATHSICYNQEVVANNNIGGKTIPNVPVNKYVAVNVIKGLKYRVETTNEDLGFIKQLTLFRDSDNTLLGTINADNNKSVAAIEAVSTFTGVIRIVFGASDCRPSDKNDDLKISYIGGSNTVDDKKAAGSNTWIGHVYDFKENAEVPPNDSDAFGTYLGQFNQPMTTAGTVSSFKQEYGGDDACFPFIAGGTNHSIYTETFAVRYKMQTTSAKYPAGCYVISIAGDDGVRLKIDDVLVFNEWKQETPTIYQNILVYLNGNSLIEFDYYEKNGLNLSEFSIQAVGPSFNTIPTGPITRCSGIATNINGSSLQYQENTPNPSVQIQWQSSTDKSNWNNIANATAEDYTVPATNPTVTTQIYYRRNVTATGGNTSACVFNSNIIAIVTSANNTKPAIPSSISTTNLSCNGFTANWAPVTNGTSYRLDVASDIEFKNYVPGYENLDIGLVTSYEISGFTIGRYYYRVRAVNGCGSQSSDSSTARSVVLSIPDIVLSGPQTVCQNDSTAQVSFQNTQAYPVTVTYQINKGDNQIINVASGTTKTVAIPTTILGILNYQLVSVVHQTNPDCENKLTNIVQITVTAPPTTPIIESISHPSCTDATGSITLSGLPSSGAWTITASPTSSDITGLSGTGTTATIKGLTANTRYTFTVSNGACLSTASSSILINPAPTKAIWNGSAWSGTVNGTSPPGITQPIEFRGNFTSSGNINGCSCTVTSGTVTIKSGNTMTITNGVQVGNNGNLIFENNASLVQTTTAKNSGAIEYRRTSSAMKNFDYTYWSSPVTGQTAKLLSPNTLSDKYHIYDPSKGWVFNDGMMNPGVGFIIRTPKPGVYGAPYPETVEMPYKQPVTFKGIPNNGDYEFKVGVDQFNLIGNPYPSAIDAKKFMETNKDIIYGALYFWTHNTAITNNDYTADDYATYTLAGGTGTAPSKNTGLNTSTPNGFIASGQSFFVGNTVAGSFKFNNDMRVSGNNSQFFNFAKSFEEEDEKHRVWLNLTNSAGAFKQLLIGYISGATNDFDNLYDGPSFDGQEFVDFYSVNKGKNLTIQGRALPFSDKDEVPLGYRSTIEGTFNISIDHRDGALAGQEIWLEDKKTATVHDLTKGIYTFTAIKGIEIDRFVLKYSNKTLGTNDNELEEKLLTVSVKNKNITINASGETIAKVQVFDLLGRIVYEKTKINSQEWIIESLALPSQTLIVKSTLSNGAISSTKIVY